MRVKRLTYLVVILVLLSIVNFVRGAAPMTVNRTARFFSVLEEKSVVFAKAVIIIQQQHIKDVKAEDLVYGAIRGMLASLEDKNCSFIPPKDYVHFREETKGKFGGLGIKIGIGEDGILAVNEALAGNPAELAGVKTGDKIIAIEGVSTVGMDEGELVRRIKIGSIRVEDIKKFMGITLPQAVDKLRGLVGTKVTIKVKRKGEKPQDITIIRKEIKLDSVAADRAKMIENEKGIGYVRLSSFTERSKAEMQAALDRLEGEGMESLILDLRGNPGGLLGSAVAIADMFIPEKKLIVYTKGREGGPVESFAKRAAKPYRLVVLVNELSASGSEIVAGAIQDWATGILVGTKTYGKGSVQNVIGLPDGSGLRITTALYYTPKGRCIDGEGIVPDFQVAARRARFPVPPGPLSEAKVREIIREELKNEKGEETPSPEAEKEDPQLARAIEILKSWEVFSQTMKTPEEAGD